MKLRVTIVKHSSRLEGIFEDLKLLNPIAPRKAKIVHNFGLSECNTVKLLVTSGGSEVTSNNS